MLKIFLTTDNKARASSFEEIQTCIDNGQNFWLDIEDPSAEEIEHMGILFKLHPTEMRKLKGKHFIRPKIEEFDDHLFVVMHAIFEYKTKEISFDTDEIIFICGAKYLVTIHSRGLLAMKTMLEDMSFHIKKGMDFFFSYIVNHVIRSYEGDMKIFQQKVEIIEEKIFFRPERKILREGFKMKREVQHLRTLFFEMLDILKRLGNTQQKDIIGKKNSIYFRDTYDFLNRLDRVAEAYHGILRNISESYLLVTSEQTNQIIKMLTFVSITVLPANLIAGIFGMNFHFTPLLSHSYGFWVSIGLMFTLSLIVAIIFKWMKWW